MSTNILPPFLKPGDLVSIVSPSSTMLDASLIDGAVRCLESWGLRTFVSPHVLSKHGHFAGTDEERLSDLQTAISDPEVKVILCSRGGYGAVRIIDKLDLTPLKSNPKWLIGFSDVTALHLTLVNAGFCSLHAPMAKALTNSHSQKGVIHAFRDILFGKKQMDYTEDFQAMNRIGEAQGTLVGGNLSLLYALQGTPYQVPAEGAILFIEDLSEKTYHIDRMMHNLRLSGALNKINGLIVGQFTDVTPDPDFGQTLEDIFLDAVGDRSIPICFNFPVGHVGRNFPLIEGAQVKLTVTEEHTQLIQI